MTTFELPRNLVSEMDAYDGPDSARRTWAAELPATVAALADRWSLTVGRPYQPGGVASWVAPVRDAGGNPLVLKVGWRHFEAEHEPDGLRAWGGQGAVRLIDGHLTGQTSALLIEACLPGTTLAASLPPAEQDVVLAGLLRRLWIEPPAGHRFRPLASMCAAWADEFEEKYARAPAALRVDTGVAAAGVAVLRELPATAERSALLCTDLHPENVLAAEREPWLVIDPKPYVGDPAYDPIQHMLNHLERIVGDAAGFADRMADLTGLDRTRVRRWLFARCVQESIDLPALIPVATDLAP